MFFCGIVLFNCSINLVLAIAVIMKLFYLLSILMMSVFFCNGQNTGKGSDIPGRTTKLVRTQGTGRYANIQCGLHDKAGNLWFGTAGEGVYRYDGQFFTQFTIKDGLNDNNVWSLLEDTAGNIWLGTGDGICRYDGEKITAVPIPIDNNLYLPRNISPNHDPSVKNEVWSMLKDRKGILWFGTRSGLYCYDGKFFTRFLDNDGIKNSDSLQLKMVECMLEDKDGTIWLGSGMIPGDEGICRYYPASGEIKAFKPNGNGWIRYMTEDKNGNIWIGTRHEGIWRYDGKTFSRFLAGYDIGLSALVDKTGNVWFSGGEKNGYLNDGSIWRYDGKSLQKISEDSLGGYSVWCMIEDKAGNIWFGTRNVGLYRYDGKTFTRFSE